MRTVLLWSVNLALFWWALIATCRWFQLSRLYEHSAGQVAALFDQAEDTLEEAQTIAIRAGYMGMCAEILGRHDLNVVVDSPYEDGEQVGLCGASLVDLDDAVICSGWGCSLEDACEDMVKAVRGLRKVI